MSVKDLYHETVKAALIKDGWTITEAQRAEKLSDRLRQLGINPENL